MIAARTDLQPANWQITATTIKCDCVDDAVTVMVDRDWTTRCTWFHRYKQKALDSTKQRFEKEIKIKIEKCLGPQCPVAMNYRDKLIQEESGTR